MDINTRFPENSMMLYSTDDPTTWIKSTSQNQQQQPERHSNPGYGYGRPPRGTAEEYTGGYNRGYNRGYRGTPLPPPTKLSSQRIHPKG